MRKCKLILIALVIVILVGSLAGCTGVLKQPDFYGTDLTDGATVSASDNSKSSDKIIGDKSGGWTTKVEGSSVEITFKQRITFNTVVIEENTDNVMEFNIFYQDGNSEYQFLYKQDRIDKYRLCATEDTSANKIKIVFDKFDKKVSIDNLSVYYLKDRKGEFRVNSYLNSNMVGDTNKTQIQDGEGKPEFEQWFKSLTDVTIIGVVNLTTDGRIDYTTGEDNFHKDVELLNKFNPNMKVHVTILLGLVPGEFKKNNNAIKKVVNEKMDVIQASVKEMVEKHNLDGVDYDWEYPQTPSEWSAYNKLIIGTKKAINGREISVALWPYGVNFSTEARSIIDTVNIMGYDQFDDRGDHSSIYEMGRKTIDYFIGLKFSREQLRLGMPFYGRTADKYAIWTQFDDSYGKWGNYKDGFTYKNADGVEVESRVYTNGYAMVRDKTALAMANDLGGIMIFSSNSDGSGTAEYSLHKAVSEVISQRMSK